MQHHENLVCTLNLGFSQKMCPKLIKLVTHNQLFVVNIASVLAASIPIPKAQGSECIESSSNLFYNEWPPK